MGETLYALALLACPVGMGAMMWFMMRGGNRSAASTPTPPAADAEVVALHAELDQLRAQVREERAPLAGGEEPR